MLRIRFASILALTAGAVSLATACSGAPTTEESEEHTGAAALRWETKGTEGEHSTHVWIVEQALELLATKIAAPVATIRTLMNDPTCDAQWRQGLDDADYLHEYNDGTTDLWHGANAADVALSGATWKSHFYDPDTGLNYLGQSNPTARSRAYSFVTAAIPHIEDGDYEQGCYELGLALHYFTDMTDPMHVVNYTNLSIPYTRHGNYENYAMGRHDAVGMAPAIFDLLDRAPEQVLVDVAKESKEYWPALSLALAGGNPLCVVGELADPFHVDHQCWAGTDAINLQVRNNLWAAQVAAARYLYAVGLLLVDLPQPRLLPSDFKATIQNASRNGSTNECVIMGSSGQNTYPERYLWGGGDNGWCGFSSRADLLANKQAVWTFHNLGGDLYTIRNASRDGSTSDCLIMGGSGQNTYPSRYLWSGGDNALCGFSSKADLLANKQAVWRVTPLTENRYAIANASADGVTNQCLIFGGSGQNTNPSRHLWGYGDNGACGLSSVHEELSNKQAIFTITVLDACPAGQTQYAEWAGGFCCNGTVGEEGGGSCSGTVCALDPTRPQGNVLCPSVMPECRAGSTRYGEWAGGFCCTGTVGEGGGSCSGTICALDPDRAQSKPLCPVCPALQTLYGEWAGGFCCDGALGPDGDSCMGTSCALDATRPQGRPLCPSVAP